VSAGPEGFLYDPLAPDFPQRIHAVYRELRDEHPVYRHPQRGFYALSRFDDVKWAAADPDLFSSEGTFVGAELLPMIVALDPPHHDRLRALVTKAFSPKRVTEMEPRVRGLAAELLDALPAREPCDLLAPFAWQLPSRVIGELIGIPKERQPAFLEWTEALVGADPTGAGANVAVFGSIYGEFAKLLAERRAERRDDLMSALLDAEIDGERLSQQELLGFCFVLITAGNDTTANLIANGAALLAQHPGQRERLAAEPARIPDAIEEMLRLEPPALQLPRRTTRELVRHGVRIPARSEVMLIWASANRDERQFEDPERFDVARRPRHLAFGHGTHFCLGANLARLEARIAFEELLRRFPRYELAAEPTWKRSFWARAHETLRVRLAR
jgi:cytochrome P450